MGLKNSVVQFKQSRQNWNWNIIFQTFNWPVFFRPLSDLCIYIKKIFWIKWLWLFGLSIIAANLIFKYHDYSDENEHFTICCDSLDNSILSRLLYLHKKIFWIKCWLWFFGLMCGANTEINTKTVKQSRRIVHCSSF